MGGSLQPFGRMSVRKYVRSKKKDSDGRLNFFRNNVHSHGWVKM